MTPDMPNDDSMSSNFLDPEEGAGVLEGVLHDNDVYLGGSALGKGFRRAARYYLQKVGPQRTTTTMEDQHLFLDGIDEEAAYHMEEEDSSRLDNIPAEDSFYVIDIGVIVSQFYQWRKHFPRVHPYYAIKCNPDPVIIQTLAILGANFDCASRQEIQLVQDICSSLRLTRTPEIIYANPCKQRSHICEAVKRGVTLMTFDNEEEVIKCAQISKRIRLILRIITDDSGSQCRLSSKFGAPPAKWHALLATAKKHGLEVVGVSFHVGSGCRDASRYDLAIRDAKELFKMAKKEFGFEMSILDIGGGFPGETHSLWNPAARDAAKVVEDKKKDEKEEHGSQFMFFDEIADHVAPFLDEAFPEESEIKLIAEPGRYLVAASSTLLVNVVAVRSNIVDDKKDELKPISNEEASRALAIMTREEEDEVVNDQGIAEQEWSQAIMDEMSSYAQLFTRQSLAQQEVDTYSHRRDFSMSGGDMTANFLAPPEEWPQNVEQHHTAEGVNSGIVADCLADDDVGAGMMTLAAAGEAAVAGVVIQSVADATTNNDDFSYYVTDGVYGAFNNIMFDHAVVRPRLLHHSSLRTAKGRTRSVSISDIEGFQTLEYDAETSSDDGSQEDLYTSTIFGPTCDSIDVISRSVLLPKLSIGDWLYFNNMGAYTMAAASSFNGFTPTEKFYVCSVQPEYFEGLLAGPVTEEK